MSILETNIGNLKLKDIESSRPEVFGQTPAELPTDPVADSIVAQEPKPSEDAFWQEALNKTSEMHYGVRGSGMMPNCEGLPTFGQEVKQVDDKSEEHSFLDFQPENSSEQKASETIFTCVNVDTLQELAAEYATETPVIDYVGDSKMLLMQAIAIEHTYKVTLPMNAYGLTVQVFKDYIKEDPDSPAVIAVNDQESLYEIVSVNGNDYLSCVSDALDTEYLFSMIARAREALVSKKHYEFRMIGYRLLRLDDGKSGRLIKTLCLNSFEMSALIQAMKSSCDHLKHEVKKNAEGDTCIVFDAENIN